MLSWEGQCWPGWRLGHVQLAPCSLFLQVCLSSFLFSHCDRKNKHSFALPTSAMGQKGKARGVQMFGLGVYIAQHGDSALGEDMGG